MILANFIFKRGFIRLLFIVVFTINFIASNAQESSQSNNGVFSAIQLHDSSTGSIELYQDVLLYQLIATQVSLSQTNGLIGYRIQINQWSGQNSRDKALAKSEVFIEKFPEFDPSLVYVDYESPYYKLRVGDFRSRNSAFEFYNQVRRYFPNSYIVKTNIEFPKLTLVNDSTEIY